MSSGYRAMPESAGAPARSPAQDPFYVVKDTVTTAMKQLRIDFERFKELLSTTNTATNQDFASAHKGLREGIIAVKADMQDLKKTVQIVEANRAKFRTIDDVELDRRKKFINDTDQTVQEIVDTLKSERTKKKLAEDKQRSNGGATPGKAGTARDRMVEQETNSFVTGRLEQHQELVAQQDIVLDDMHSALARLGDVAVTISDELEVQNAMLEDTNNAVGDTQNSLDTVQAKLEKLLKSSDKGKLCCIAVLFIVVIALFIALIYG